MTDARDLLKRDMQFVNQKLNDWDFIGVADEVDDEYDCLIGEVTRMLRDESGPAPIVEFLNREIQEHFGMGHLVSGTKVKSFVNRLSASWALEREGTVSTQ